MTFCSGLSVEEKAVLHMNLNYNLRKAFTFFAKLVICSSIRANNDFGCSNVANVKKELKSKKKFEKFILNRISSYQTSKDKLCLSF